MSDFTDKSIPRIMHQLWIGPKEAPIKMMNTWKAKHPDFEYIRWTENEFRKRKKTFRCQQKIDQMHEWNGKADIMRWELLYEYGGVFLDADSICIEPIDEQLMRQPCFAGWEHEELRKGLIATGTMGFPKQHPLVGAAIEWILNNDIMVDKMNKAAWIVYGPGCLTKIYNSGLKSDLKIFPSYYFLPIHCTGATYNGHGKVYAFQEWGSTKQSYDTINDITLPDQFTKPQLSVSVLVSSYNTKAIYIKECLESIKSQIGHFNIELVWINDGSTDLNTALLLKQLDKFKEETRYIDVVYSANDGNKGIGFTLNRGIHMCSHEIIIKMDSDDIMLPDRIFKQATIMQNNPQLMLMGAQINCFNDINESVSKTNHPNLTWEQYKQNPSHWFINHPTVCYRKQAVIDAGNYDDGLRTKDGDDDLSHDFELELRMLKKYGMIYNSPDVMLNYRLHPEQVTHAGGKSGSAFWRKIRMKLIKNFINS